MFFTSASSRIPQSRKRLSYHPFEPIKNAAKSLSSVIFRMDSINLGSMMMWSMSLSFKTGCYKVLYMCTTAVEMEMGLGWLTEIFID